jgi:hypothetical protein
LLFLWEKLMLLKKEGYQWLNEPSVTRWY